METSGLLYQSASCLVRRIKSGEVTSVDVVTAHLDQIARHNPKIHAVVTLTREKALSDARLADERVASGQPLPPLLGVPITVKDSFRMEGVRTTFGLPIFHWHVPGSDCEVIRRVRKSGAVIFKAAAAAGARAASR